VLSQYDSTSFRPIGTKIKMFVLGTCLEIAARQECDAQCNDGETTDEDLRGERIPTRRARGPSLKVDRCLDLYGD
jgi:hypothetical protein